MTLAAATMPFADVPEWVLLVFFFSLILSGWVARRRPPRRVRAGATGLLLVAVLAWLTVGGWLAAVPMLAYSALVGDGWWAVRRQVAPTAAGHL